MGTVPEADFRGCGGSCLGGLLRELVWLLGRWEEVRGSSWVHLHIRWVRLRFRRGLGEGVAVSWMELVELRWSIMAESSDVWRGGLVGGSMLGWLVCGPVVVTRLKHCGWGWASAVDAWASLVVWSMSWSYGALINRPVEWVGWFVLGQILSVGQVTLMVHWVAVEAAIIVLVGVVAVWTWMVA